jgi:hypothetical protein
MNLEGHPYPYTSLLLLQTAKVNSVVGSLIVNCLVLADVQYTNVACTELIRRTASSYWLLRANLVEDS